MALRARTSGRRLPRWVGTRQILYAGCALVLMGVTPARGQDIGPATDPPLTTLPREVVAGWFPRLQSDPRPGEVGPLAPALARISAGDFAGAEPLVRALERDHGSPRARVRAAIARPAAEVSRFRLLNSGQMILEGPARGALLRSAVVGDSLESVAREAVLAFSGAERQAAELGLTLAQLLICYEQATATLRMLPAVPIAEVQLARDSVLRTSLPCGMQLPEVLGHAARSGLLASLDSLLMSALLEGDRAAALGDPLTAQRLFATASFAADRAGNRNARVEFQLRLFDLAYISGSPRSLGLGLGMIPLDLVLPSPPAGPLPPGARTALAQQYLLLESSLAAAGVPAGDSRLLLRRAILAQKAGDPDSAQVLYRRAAAAAGADAQRDAVAALAGVAVLTGERDDVQAALGRALTHADSGAAISVLLIASSAARDLMGRGELNRALTLLQAAADAAAHVSLDRPAVGLYMHIAEVQAARGRAEAAMVALFNATARQRSYLSGVRPLVSRLSRDRPSLRGAAADVLAVEAFLQISLLSELLNQVRSRGFEEGTLRWSDQEDRILAERAQLAAADPRLTSMVAAVESRERELQQVLPVMQAYLQTRADCPSFVARLREMNLSPAIDLTRNLHLALQVSACDPTQRERLRAHIEQQEPVLALAGLLRQGAAQRSFGDAMRVDSAFFEVNTHLGVALGVGAHQTVRRWIDQLEALAREAPALEGLRAMALGAEMALLLAQERIPEAREKALSALTRMQAMPGQGGAGELARLYGTIADLELRLGNSEAALAAYERMLFQQENDRRERSGVRRSSRDEAEILMLERQIAVAGRASDAQLARLRALRGAASRTAAAAMPAPSPEDLRRLVRAIPPDMVVLVYRVDGPRMSAWRIDSGGITGRVLPDSSLIVLRAADALREALLERYGTYREPAAFLHRVLVEPLGPLPEGSLLVIVPAPAMQGVPFEVLGPSTEDMLLMHHPVIYAARLGRLPSPALAAPRAAQDRTPTGTGRTALVVGLDAEGLEFAEAEAQEVARVLGARTLLGPDAMPDRVLDALPTARIVHIATHATVDLANPLLSFLTLADGPLDAWKFFRFAPDAELVVLSACQTSQSARGLFSLSPVAGVGSLAELAIEGGARWVVASLWPVSDPTTAPFMAGFYTRLQAGSFDVPAALRLEKAEAAAGQHPFFYAPFVVTVRDVATVLEDQAR